MWNTDVTFTSNSIHHGTCLPSVLIRLTIKSSFKSSLPSRIIGIMHHWHPISGTNCFSLATSEIRVANIKLSRFIRNQNAIIQIYVVPEESKKSPQLKSLLSEYGYIIQTIFIYGQTYVHMDILYIIYAYQINRVRLTIFNAPLDYKGTLLRAVLCVSKRYGS